MKPYYEQSGITIYHGDCREILPSVSCDLLLADPPYGVPSLFYGGCGRSHSRLPGAGPAANGYRVKVARAMVGNEAPFDPAHLLGFEKAILWGANHYADKLPSASRWLAWDKREGQTSDTGADCELAWTNLGGPARLFRHLWRGMVKRGVENGAARLHPTQKPEALMVWCIAVSGIAAGMTVCDPYMGSGTALVAAKRGNHRAIGIEIDERYCEIAATRLQQEALPLEVA